MHHSLLRLVSIPLLAMNLAVYTPAQSGPVTPNPGDVVVHFDLVGVTTPGGNMSGFVNFDFTQHGWTTVEIHYPSGIGYGNPSSDPVHVSPTLITGSHNSQTTSYDFEMPLATALTPTSGSPIQLDPPGTPVNQLNAWFSVDNGTTATIYPFTAGALVPVIPTWLELGFAKAGGSGTPHLTGTGTLTGNSTNHVDLTAAAPSSICYLVIGFGQQNLPFQGGILVPDLTFLVPLTTDALGTTNLTFPWFSFLPAGLTTYFQCWIADPAASFGLSASNGLRGFSH